jgi:putative Flp pilus-assembly TadE/G-like protein
VLVNGVSRMSSEDGGIVVLTAALMMFFVLLGSVAIDLGNWFVHERHLQTQVDAAALAGGGLLGKCFAQPATAYTQITDEATRYSGVGASDLTYPNTQVGGTNQGTISMLYQSKTYASGGPGPDDTEVGDPCLTPSLMFDVKGTEQALPTLIPFPGISSLGTVRTHARVQLKKVIVFKGSLPLAVPEVNPTRVTATFVNEAGNVVSSFELTGPTATGGLNAWAGSGSVAVPAGAMLGVRIGVGQVAGVCSAANKTGGTGFVCYDYSQFDKGLVSIAGYSDAGTPAAAVRSSFEVWPVTACSGSPFFSDTSLAAGATTCAAAVQAKLHFASGTALPADVKTFRATVNGPSGFKVSSDLTESGGVWSTGYSLPIPVDGGPYDVTLDWEYKTGGKKSFLVQRIYSATDDSGPVKVVTLTGAGGTGAPYSLAAGTRTIGVNVALEGSLQLSAPGEMIMLRLTGGSRSSAIACDGTGASEFRDAIVNGCSTPYQINAAPAICPASPPLPSPADCVPIKTGAVAGPTLQGLDERFSACPAYSPPPNLVPDDPRVIPLMITDFSALGGSGATEVPVTNFATFYVAGWTGSTCGNNPPPPFDVKKGAIWGHFIKYAQPDPNAETGETCDPNAVTPCVPVLTR